MGLKELVDGIAERIGARAMFARHEPEPSARPGECFTNVLDKVRLSGGSPSTGWTLHTRLAQGIGEYVFLEHHAVWKSPDRFAIDITPFRTDPLHHPVAVDGLVIFFADEKAEPVHAPGFLAPLPMRFFPLTDEPQLIAYVEELNESERAACRRVYEGRVPNEQIARILGS